MKILSIGNSFSQDAHKWLHDIAAAQGLDIYTANLYIGGCSLETHYNNIKGNKADYEYEINGGECSRMISINEALTLDDWDIVTLQQASHFSGRPQTYFPYLESVCNYVKGVLPDARIYIHETWSYEIDSWHEAFADYNKDQGEMYRRLHDCYIMAGKVIGAPVIPVGTVIESIRHEIPEFDFAGGKRSIHRDGFHLSLNYGRYAAAATWISFITGADLRGNSFVPQVEGLETDPALIKKIQDKVYEKINMQKN